MTPLDADLGCLPLFQRDGFKLEGAIGDVARGEQSSVADRLEADEWHQIELAVHLAEVQQHEAGVISDPLARRLLADEHTTIEEIPPVVAPLRGYAEVADIDLVVRDVLWSVLRIGQAI